VRFTPAPSGAQRYHEPAKAEEALVLQLYRVVRELEMSQAKELEGVRQAEASKIKTVYVPRIGETD